MGTVPVVEIGVKVETHKKFANSGKFVVRSRYNQGTLLGTACHSNRSETC